MLLKNHAAHYFVACSLILTNIYATAATRSVCMQTIGSMHMQSLGLTLEKPQLKDKIKDAKQALTLSLPEHEQLRLIYQLCAQQEAKLGISQTTDDEGIKNLLTDLEIFVSKGQQPKETVFNKTIGGYTHTLWGHTMAAKMLATPETSSEKLLERQALINELATNDQLRNAIENILRPLKDSEKQLLSFWQEEPELTKKLIAQLFFTVKPLRGFNKNSMVLEALTRFDHLKTALDSTAVFTAFTLFAYLSPKLARKITGQPIPQPSLWEAIKGTASLYNPLKTFEAVRLVRSREFEETNIATYKEKLGREPSIDELATHSKIMRTSGYVGCGIVAAFNAWLIYNAESGIKRGINHTLLARDIANFLQERLIGVAAHVNALSQIQALATQSPSLYLAIPALKETEALFVANVPDDLHELVKLLMTNTFTGSASFFSLTGRVLAAYTLMQEQKDNFIQSLMTLGELDACLATANLQRKFQGDRVGYSFAEYQNFQTPHVKVTDFWNPLVDKNIVVTNSMELGKPVVERNMILTGSNTGGKSTLLKAMALNVLMAQTLTIVPALAYQATPFAYLATYMNINDDTATGNSLFKAEVLRIKKLVESIELLSEKDFGFVVIDELFTGTDADKAAEGAYNIAHHCSQSPNACFILATHHTKTMSALEQETKGICKNFKIDANKNMDGIIKRSFKLEPGISSNNIALDILHHELTEVDFSQLAGN